MPSSRSRYRGALFAREIRHWHGDPQRRFRLGDAVGGDILCLQFGCVEGGIGDLQDAEDLVVAIDG